MLTSIARFSSAVSEIGSVGSTISISRVSLSTPPPPSSTVSVTSMTSRVEPLSRAKVTLSEMNLSFPTTPERLPSSVTVTLALAEKENV